MLQNQLVAIDGSLQHFSAAEVAVEEIPDFAQSQHVRSE